MTVPGIVVSRIALCEDDDDLETRYVEMTGPPAVEFTGDLAEVNNVSGYRDDDNFLPNPIQWEHMGDTGPADIFSGLRTGAPELPLNTKGEAAVLAAALATEAFVHEIMEWLCIDGQRAFNPHPDEAGAMFTMIGQDLKDLFTDLLIGYKDPDFDPES